MCFDREHIKLFIKKLRVYITRYWFKQYCDKEIKIKINRKLRLIQSKNDKRLKVTKKDRTISRETKSNLLKKAYLKTRGIKYIVFSEFGSDPRFTQRSHYHALVFLPFKLPGYVIRLLFKKSWCNGMVRWSPRGEEVKSSAGLKYCSKYSTKDLGFYEKYDYEKIISHLALHGDDTLKDFRRRMPFHLQSLGFGSPFFEEHGLTSDGIHYEVNDFLIKNEIYFDNDGNTDESFYTIPHYYRDKCIYDFSNSVRIPNSNARKYFSAVYDNLLQQTISKLDKYLSYIHLSQLHYSCYDRQYSTPSALWSELHSKLDDYGITTDMLAKYLLVYRDVHLDTHHDNAPDVYTLLDKSKEFYLQQKLSGLELDELLPCKLKEYNPAQYIHEKTNQYSRVPIFEICEIVLQQLFQLYNDDNLLVDESKKLKTKELRSTREKENYAKFKHI